MPPRWSNRKGSSRTKKLTPKSKQPDVESSSLAGDSAVTELENKGQELAPSEETGTQQEDVSAEAKVQEAEEEGQPVIEEKESKQEIDFVNANSMVTEGLESGGEDKVVASTVVQLTVVEEEWDADIVMEDHVNVNTEVVEDGRGVADQEREKMDDVENEGGDDKNDNANTVDVVEKGGNAVEEEGGVGGDHNEGEDVGNDDSQSGFFPVAEQNSAEEEAVAAQINNAKSLGDTINVLDVKEGSNGEGEDSEDDEEDDGDGEEDNEDEEDPFVFVQDPLTDVKKQKDLEIFIGSLDKGAVEDDLIKVFGKFGEIKTARVVRNPTTKKSKGFAFIRYATVEQAKNALSELKDGIEVRGKHVKISASQDNDTLYMGNICKTWTKERVLGTLKHYGIEHIEEIHLPDDPKNSGSIKGFAFLEFSTHSDAMAAFQRLRKPDAVFGHDRSAKVAFTQTSMHPNDEVLAQVKANIAKPHFRGRLQKQGFRGGFKVKETSKVSPLKKESERSEQAGPSKRKGHVKSKRAKRKRKMAAEEKGKALSDSKIVEGNKPNKHPSVTEGQSVGAPSKLGRTNRKRKNLTSKVESRGDRSIERVQSKRPSKKLRGNMRGRQSNNFRNPKRGPHIRKGSDYVSNSATYRNPHASGYAASTAYYQGHAYSANSASKRHYTDMEPHAGYLEPAVGTHGRPHAGYIEPAVGTQVQPHAAYFEHAVGTQVQAHASYTTVWTRVPSHGRFLEPAVGTQGQSYAEYSQPALGIQGHDPYVPGLRRTGGLDGQASSSSAYGGVGSALPPSYVPIYTSYAGYEGGANVGGYYQSSGAYLPRRAYH